MKVYIYDIHDSHVCITHVHNTQNEAIVSKVLANTAHEEAEQVCCSVLQCVAMCCSALQCVANTAHGEADKVCCSVLQCVAVC